MLLQGPARQGKAHRNRSKVSCKQHLLKMGRHHPSAPPSLPNVPPHGHPALQRPRATGCCWHKHSNMQNVGVPTVCHHCTCPMGQLVLLLDQGLRSMSHMSVVLCNETPLSGSHMLPSGLLCNICQTSLMWTEDTSACATCPLPSTQCPLSCLVAPLTEAPIVCKLRLNNTLRCLQGYPGADYPIGFWLCHR